MYEKPLIFGVIISLSIVFIDAQYAVFDLYASPMIGGTFDTPQTGGVFSESPIDEGAEGEPPADDGTAERRMGPSTCVKIPGGGTIGQVECCAFDENTMRKWCTTCDATNPPSNCGPAEEEIIERLGNGTVPSGGTFEEQPSGPAVPPGNVGTLQNQSVPGDPFATPNGGGVFNTPQTGGVFNALPPPTEEGTQPPTLTDEPAPVCPEGQVLDEQTNLCALEESDESGEETEQQSSEEDSSEDNSNDDNEDDDENN
jgi:hypothetical protein